MWWVLKNVTLSDLLIQLENVGWSWMCLLGVLFIIQQLIRAYRQQIIVNATHPEHGFNSSHSVICIGFLFINTLPARLGELARPLLLKSKEGIPIGMGMAMVFTERIFDLIAALIMLTLVLAFSNIAIMDSPWIDHGQTAAAIALPVLILTMGLLIFKGETVVQRLPNPRIKRLLNGFMTGLSAQRKAGNLTRLCLLTAITWSFTGLFYICAAHAFSIENIIGYVEGIGILSFTMIGMVPPNAPGFVGTYEAAFIEALRIFGVSDANVQVAMAFSFHLWITVVQALTAIAYLTLEGIDIKHLLSGLFQSRVKSKA